MSRYITEPTLASINPILYCLMRTDLYSLNPGKAIAQGMHAANMLSEQIMRLPKASKAKKWYDIWKADRDFGTTIVLGGSGKDIWETLLNFQTLERYPWGIVHDPTYPITDGSVTHLIPLDTCGFAFGPKNELAPKFEAFGLHP